MNFYVQIFSLKPNVYMDGTEYVRFSTLQFPMLTRKHGYHIASFKFIYFL